MAITKYLKISKRKKKTIFGVFSFLSVVIILCDNTTNTYNCQNFDINLFRHFMINTNMDLFNNIIGKTKIHSLNIYKTLDILMSPISPCFKHKNLIIIVKSSAEHFTRRLNIRQTWANKSNASFFIYFTIGYTERNKRDLQRESDDFDDIIVGNFLDSYRNNTLKTIMTYRWLHIHCSHIPFVLLVDDDYTVNVYNVLEFVKDIKIGSICPMFGSLVKNWHPVRHKSDPNSYITKQEYPLRCYPDYISGGSLITCINTVKAISALIPYVRPFSIDDAYIGVISTILKIPLYNEPRMLLKQHCCENIGSIIAIHKATKSRCYRHLCVKM